MIAKRQIQQSTFISHSPIFYGWVIWAVATLGIIFTSPGQAYTIALFIDHYIADFGLSRTEVSSLFSLGTFVSAMTLTWVGKWIDLYGNRTMGTIAIVLFAIVLILSSLVVGPITLFLSFFALRFLGQGALFLTSSTVITHWWVHRRGWVMGWSMVIFALFRSVYLPYLQHTIDHFGWRDTWLIHAALLALIMLPLWLLFIRNQPEQFGITPDGTQKQTKGESPAITSFTEHNWTLTQARHTAILWVVVVGRMLVGAIGTALIFHQTSMFQMAGHSALKAAETYATLAIITALVTPFIGYNINRIRPNFMLIIQMLLMIVTLLISIFMRESWMLLVFAITFGIIMGIGGTFDNTVWADLFGRLHHGSIRGFVTTIQIIGTAIGPVVFAKGYDLTGNYNAIIFISIGVLLIESVFCLFVKLPATSP